MKVKPDVIDRRMLHNDSKVKGDYIYDQLPKWSTVLLVAACWVCKTANCVVYVFNMTSQVTLNEPEASFSDGEEVHVKVSSQRMSPSHRGHALDMEDRDPTKMNDHVKV